MTDETKKEECPICAMIERFNNYNTDPDVGQACPTCPPEEKALYDELYKLLRRIKGLNPKDAAVIANLKDKELREDLAKIIFHVDESTNEMTRNGQRIEWTTGNNTYRVINGKIKDCGEQAEHVNSQLAELGLNYNWNFIGDSSIPVAEFRGVALLPGHSWGQAYAVDSKNKVVPDLPYLTYDPRERSFGLNRDCPSCSGALGLSSGILEDSPIFEGRK